MDEQRYVVIAKRGEVWKLFTDPLQSYEEAINLRDQLKKHGAEDIPYGVLALPREEVSLSVPVAYLHPDAFDVAEVAHEIGESEGFMNGYWIALKEILQWLKNT